MGNFGENTDCCGKSNVTSVLLIFFSRRFSSETRWFLTFRVPIANSIVGPSRGTRPQGRALEGDTCSVAETTHAKTQIRSNIIIHAHTYILLWHCYDFRTTIINRLEYVVSSNGKHPAIRVRRININIRAHCVSTHARRRKYVYAVLWGRPCTIIKQSYTPRARLLIVYTQAEGILLLHGPLCARLWNAVPTSPGATLCVSRHAVTASSHTKPVKTSHRRLNASSSTRVIATIVLFLLYFLLLLFFLSPCTIVRTSRAPRRRRGVVFISEISLFSFPVSFSPPSRRASPRPAGDGHHNNNIIVIIIYACTHTHTGCKNVWYKNRWSATLPPSIRIHTGCSTAVNWFFLRGVVFRIIFSLPRRRGFTQLEPTGRRKT